MPCFGTRTKKARLKYVIDHTILIHADIPCNPAQYLPHVSKHIIQEEADSVIDDPSSIFFDPKEKSDFVYSATPFLTSGYQKYSPTKIHSYPAVSYDVDNKHLTKALENHHIRESPISSEYDDSLDRTRSLQNTPLYKTDNVFGEHFEVSSRKDSLEFDPIGMDSDYHAVLNQTEDNLVGLSEAQVKKLYESSHEGSLVGDYVDLQLYKDELLNSCENNMRIKGYFSDAESTKTYQDSGIYDDDVFIDSPKHTSEEYANIAQRLVFGTEQEEVEEGYGERYSAFKTPMSSRQNSLDSILSVSSPIQQPLKLTRKEAQVLAADKSSKPSSNKYSHIQAKVQCRRKKCNDRSPSPGASLRKKSPSTTKPPMVFGKFNRHSSSAKSNTSIEAKVDSLSNIKYESGGGEKKIFKERLTFRENAKPRTDTHGIEMYSHLPEEFQEIARRLARQDNQLKRQESQRGRSLSRSRTSSRQSSVSPTRGRTRTRRANSRKLTPGNSISDIFAAVNSTKEKMLVETASKVTPSLSRSSSVRSIPSTPHLSRQHPSITVRNGQKSPTPVPLTFRRRENKTPTAASNEKSRNKLMPGTQHQTSSDHPSPVSKLYQFTTQNDSFGSPQYSANPIFHSVSVR